MNTNEITIKSIKSNFRHCSDLATPVICHLIKSLNMQEDYSVAVVDKFKEEGYEVLSPKKQGRLWYEIPQKNILLSSSIGLTSIIASILYPLYSIPLISLGLFISGYTYYYRNYFYQNIEEGYQTLQDSKGDIGEFLKSVMLLKRQLQEVPEDLIPVDIKAKNVKGKLSNLINTVGYSIYLNIDNSNKVKIIDVIRALEISKEIFSSGSHPELYFYEAINKQLENNSPETIKEVAYEGSLDLGDKPDFTFKEDAISEGIKIAKALNSSNRTSDTSTEPKKPKVAKKTSKTPTKKNENGLASPVQTSSLSLSSVTPSTSNADDQLTAQGDNLEARNGSSDANPEEFIEDKIEVLQGDPFDDLDDSDDLPEAIGSNSETVSKDDDESYDDLLSKLEEDK